MIETIEEALDFYAERELEFEAFGANILKPRVKPLVSISETVDALGLPREYVQCVEWLQVEGVELGFFDLCPGSSNDLCQSLLAINGESRNPILPGNMVHVAAFESDIVAVSSGDPYHGRASVYLIDVTMPVIANTRAIADNFEDFLVFASALDQAILEKSKNVEATMTDFLSRKGHSNFIEQWKRISNMVI